MQTAVCNYAKSLCARREAVAGVLWRVSSHAHLVQEYFEEVLGLPQLLFEALHAAGGLEAGPQRKPSRVAHCGHVHAAHHVWGGQERGQRREEREKEQGKSKCY